MDKEKFDKVVNLLHNLFEQADEDTPSQCRSRHFRDTMSQVEEMLIELIKKCFSQRRKTIKNNLKKIMNSPNEILFDSEINPSKRAQELDFNDFINLSNSFSKNEKNL